VGALRRPNPTRCLACLLRGREWARQKLKKLLDVSFVREIRWHDLLQLLLLTLEVDYPLDFLQL
jgi:hypothetical protein